MTNPMEISWLDRVSDYIGEGISGGFPVNPFTYAYKGACLSAAELLNLCSKGTGDRIFCPGELDDALYNINFLEQHPDREKDFLAINNTAAGLYQAVLIMQRSYASRYGAEECRVSGVQTDLEDLANVMRAESPARCFFEAERGPVEFFKGRKHEPNIFKRIKNYIFGGKTEHIVVVNGEEQKVVRKHKHLFKRIWEGLTGGDHHRNVFREFVHWFKRGKFVRRYLKMLDYLVKGTIKTGDEEEKENKEKAKIKYLRLKLYVKKHLKETLGDKYGGNQYYYRKLGLMLNRLAWRHRRAWGEDLQDDYGGMVPKIDGKELQIDGHYVVKAKGEVFGVDTPCDTQRITDYDLQADALLRYYDRKAKGKEAWRRKTRNLNQFVHSGYFSYTLDNLGRLEKTEPVQKTRFELVKDNKRTSMSAK